MFWQENNTDGNSGARADKWAQQYLKNQALNIFTSNYRTPHGEIDLIMREGNTLVFVEVRLRSA
ncbi:MAG: putative endonuclease [Porticoccus sp.]|jgi:putative endonuclease